MKKLIIAATLIATSLLASDGAALYKKCTTCHGSMGEKKALGKSKVIGTWSAQKVEKALTGYQDGTYGGIMKKTMQSQVSRLSSEEIKTLSAYIDSLM